VVCDTAHNADGLKQVLQQVSETPYRNLHLLLGFVNDKDIHEILKYMPQQAGYYFTRLAVPRTMNEKELAATALQYGLRGQTYGNVRDAYDAVTRNAEKDDLIVITGSNFLVADFLGEVERWNSGTVKQ
jgi:dihydrofolate synthase/folylpolyglutamate synthase